MNKAEFLEKLAQRLKMLRSDEVTDILEEYGGYIDVKIAEGKTEQQAVADFGSIEELSREILAAYKLSDEYIPKSGKVNFDAVTDFLNQTVDFAADFFRSIFTKGKPNQALSIFLSIMVALIVIAVLKLPFMLFEEIGKDLIGFIFPGFLDRIVRGVWIAAVNICYLVTVVLIMLALFKSGFGRNLTGTGNGSHTDCADGAQDTQHDDRVQQPLDSPEAPHGSAYAAAHAGSMEEPSSRRQSGRENVQAKEEKHEQTQAAGAIGGILLALAKVFVFLMLLPVYLLIIGLGISFGALVYLLTQGISVYGPALVLFSLLLMSSVVTSAVTRLIFSERKKQQPIAGTVIFAAILLGFGGVFCAFEFVSYDYIDQAPPAVYGQEVVRYEYPLDAKKIIIKTNHSRLNVENSDRPGKTLTLDVAYDDAHMNVDVDRSTSDGGSTQELSVRYETDADAVFQYKTVYDSVMAGLKEKRIYDYSRLFAPAVTVYISPEQRKYVTVYGDMLVYER